MDRISRNPAKKPTGGIHKTKKPRQNQSENSPKNKLAESIASRGILVYKDTIAKQQLTTAFPFPTITVGDLKQALNEWPDDTLATYACDNEGNEFRFVHFLPSSCLIKKPRSPRFLTVVDHDDPEFQENPQNFVECVCLN